MSENTLYQFSTIGSLMAGAMDGMQTVAEFLTHGDLGIGTTDGVDGELIVLDGKAYKISASGKVVSLKDTVTIPYGAIAKFHPNHQIAISSEMSSENVEEEIFKQMRSKNLFSGVKITGKFKHMHTRAMPKQEPPYVRFSEVEQPNFYADDIEGTLVGFYSPVIFHGASVAGFHVHFISDDHHFGGHVLDYIVENVTIEIQDYQNMLQDFPKTDDFLDTALDYKNIAEEITLSE